MALATPRAPGLQLFYTANTLTICQCGKGLECRSSLPKSRSIEIANSKNGLPSVTDVRAGAKPKFRRRYHGCLNWLAAAARFLQRIFYTKRAILPAPAVDRISRRPGAR